MPASKDLPGAAGSAPASSRTRAACASTQGVTAPSSAAPAGRTQVRTRGPNTLAVRQLLGITTSYHQIAPHGLTCPRTPGKGIPEHGNPDQAIRGQAVPGQGILANPMPCDRRPQTQESSISA